MIELLKVLTAQTIKNTWRTFSKLLPTSSNFRQFLSILLFVALHELNNELVNIMFCPGFESVSTNSKIKFSLVEGSLFFEKMFLCQF